MDKDNREVCSLKHHKIILHKKNYIFQLTSFVGKILQIKNNFILIPGSVQKQLGSGSGFRILLDPDTEFWQDPYSMNMDPKHWVTE